MRFNVKRLLRFANTVVQVFHQPSSILQRFSVLVQPDSRDFSTYFSWSQPVTLTSVWTTEFFNDDGSFLFQANTAACKRSPSRVTLIHFASSVGAFNSQKVNKQIAVALYKEGKEWFPVLGCSSFSTLRVLNLFLQVDSPCSMPSK